MERYNIKNLFQWFRSINDWREWFENKTSEDIYNLFNQFIYEINIVLLDYNELMRENIKLKKDMVCLKNHLSKISINDLSKANTKLKP